MATGILQTPVNPKGRPSDRWTASGRPMATGSPGPRSSRSGHPGGSQRSGLSRFMNEGAGPITSGGRSFSGLSRECAQLFGVDPQIFDNVDPPGESVVVGVALMRQHDAVILVDRRPSVSRIQREISDHSSVSMFCRKIRRRGATSAFASATAAARSRTCLTCWA
jgi:hypothetical protein